MLLMLFKNGNYTKWKNKQNLTISIFLLMKKQIVSLIKELKKLVASNNYKNNLKVIKILMIILLKYIFRKKKMIAIEPI